jgi:sugar/nucleoside kinase (ribokinase family)
VACCGLTTLDVVQYADQLPGPDEKVGARAARLEFGGPAANAAFTAATLGARVTLITALGFGPVGDVIRAQLTGVEVVDCAPQQWQAPVSSVTVVGEARSVVSTNAGTARTSAPPPDALDGCDALLVDGHHLGLCVQAATTARRHGIPVLLDGGSWKPGLEHLLPLVDAAVLSADFHPPAALDWAGRPVAISRGGAPIVCGGRRIPVPAVDVVDTVGAGDVLHGALLVHLAREGLGAFETGLRRAARVASESCRYPGAHAWAAHRVTTMT